jgi:hypothetical protein
MDKYHGLELIKTEDETSPRNIEIMKINSLIFIANELAEANELKRKELVRANQL